MSAYFIVDIEVRNVEEYQKYIAFITPSLKNYGGTYLVRGGDPETLDGDWQSNRIVVMCFPDKTRAKEWLHAPELQMVHQMRRNNASKCNMIICEGVE